VVKLLVARKANPRAADDGGDTVLHLATHRGNVQIVEFLLQQGADPNTPNNYHGRTPLHVAATKGRPELVKLLLAYKGDASFRSKIGQTPLEESRAPLNDDAPRTNRQETIRLLEEASKR
jgi:ankyrin repeat protein